MGSATGAAELDKIGKCRFLTQVRLRKSTIKFEEMKIMIDYAAMKATEVPQDALAAYAQYKGDQHAAATARDYSALSKMQAWGAFIEIQGMGADTREIDDEGRACPLCGAGGGTRCGAPSCQY